MLISSKGHKTYRVVESYSPLEAEEAQHKHEI